MKITSPATLGFDPDRLQRIDRFLQQRYIETGRLLGTQLLISRDGEPVHFASTGAMRQDGVPTRPDTIYRIASMTKPITSVAFMMQVEEGRVALDDRVDTVVPEFANVGVHAAGGSGGYVRTPPERPMLMIDLLRHTSGLTYGFQNRTVVDAAYREAGIEAFHGNHDLDSMAGILGQLPLEFSPGELWNYSMATDVLGLIVQRLDGAPLDQVLKRRLFDPLGMTDTGFVVPADKVDRLADCHAVVPGGVALYDEAVRSRWLRQPKLLSGGGGLVSTSADYHRFCRMMMDGGALDGARILSPKTIALMTANHLPGNSDLTSLSRSMFSEATNAGIGFGLGLAVTMDPARTMLAGSAGEYHWGGMFSTAFFIDPVERIITVFMAQLSPSSTYPVRRELRTMIYGALVDSRVRPGLVAQ
ncbi:CubicO group peptidase (beta-lactamase class C family) [Sphingomonas jejuensis]|uniref:CubicO group peptidase (Beta-lactamase class C family) n=1 Tax=Sphingomonas jejuensis TaxID=904715 RepID=A0ABX0XM47_9SPHN|nr:serine hydrolase domain-containing protein [Sphingomonas jejuensis]NJC34309.1 CubicO group peptidase (beta-lactamase class C family) [Sphingomonas jejuensis]